MTRTVRGAFALASALVFAIAPVVTAAQPETAESNTVPISTILAAVAKRSGKKFMVDPRVRADVLLLQENPAALTYDDLLVLLQVHGFAAVTDGDYVRVVPDAAVRQMTIPTADDDKHRPAEYVTRIIPVKNLPAAMLVPILRPMIPQHGHLVAMTCSNDLLMIDTFGNVQRLEKLIRSLDRGEPFRPAKCSGSEVEPADK